jgi:hypothetical protein
MEKKFGNADLECGVYRLMYQDKEAYLHPRCRLLGLVTWTQMKLYISVFQVQVSCARYFVIIVKPCKETPD